jgi:hypothetical protein
MFKKSMLLHVGYHCPICVMGKNILEKIFLKIVVPQHTDKSQKIGVANSMIKINNNK